ncbi:MAG: DUF370 domain-containing protein [Lachnospiraceae bacterium]
MKGLMNIGFGNLVQTDKIVAIVTPDSSPSKRLVQRAKQEERIIDATQGRKTRSIIVAENNMIVLSALGTETLQSRFYDIAKMTEVKNER